jgi:hypothetical protein
MKMKDSNTPPIFDVDELETAQEWLDRKGKSAFVSQDHFDWFTRLYRYELLKSGNYFPSSRCVPTRVGPDFGKLIIQIMQRRAAFGAEPE